MSIIKLHDKTFKKFIGADTIRTAIKNMARLIGNDCRDEVPVFVGILNGSFMFVADFLREYRGLCEVSFVKLSSYQDTRSTGKVKQLVGLTENIENRTVIILEDIIDTGNTLEEIYDIFRSKKIKELKIATLFFKPDVFRKSLPVDYIGIPIPDEFILGYGLDYNGLGRNLADVYQLTTTTMKNIVLFGPPGAGKGTQAKILSTKFNLVHISTGEVFRFNIRNETQLGKLAKLYIDKGDLVPDAITIEMLKEEVEKHPEAKGFVFDGFPRTLSQAEALDMYLEEKGEMINGMISIEVPEEILVSRLLKRGKTSGRVDDQDEGKIRNRFHEYHTKTAVLKDYYQKQNKFHGVEGNGTIEEVNVKLCDTVEKL